MGDLIRAQHGIHAPGLNGADRHTRKACRSRVLRERGATTLPDRLYAESTVGASAGQDHADRAVSTVFSKRSEQRIPRVMEPAHTGCHGKSAASDCQRSICAHHVNMITLWHN